jgi:thiamine pyrophosphate-dependent acetolactate synthase large subunit-like protein
MMPRRDCLSEIAALRGDALVVAVYSAAFDWLEICPHPLNFFAVGVMGQGSSAGLGFAIGLPNRKIVVLDGDGSLLMNLGSLVTIAGVAPKNFVHFLFQNNCYEVNGKHPIPDADHISFAGLARAAGYQTVADFEKFDTFRKELPAFMDAPGPAFATLRIDPGPKRPLDYSLLHSVAAREALQRALQMS